MIKSFLLLTASLMFVSLMACSDHGHGHDHDESDSHHAPNHHDSIN